MPRALNYPEEQIQQYGLIKRSFIFNVDGTYTDLRKFINLLELSDSFLTLESAGLTEVTQRSAAGRPGFAGVPQFGPGRAAVPPLPTFLSTSWPIIITQLWLSGMIRRSVGWL